MQQDFRIFFFIAFFPSVYYFHAFNFPTLSPFKQVIKLYVYLSDGAITNTELPSVKERKNYMFLGK
jgi:hypothetical protein